MPDWLSLYHSLPYWARSLAASTHGMYLSAWRYDRHTDTRVREAFEREQWPATRYREWQEVQLAHLLHRAATRVPYYRRYWQERRQRGDRASWELLENWPLLKKEAVRTQPKAFVADDCHTKRMFHEQTSGTTGTPIHLWWSRDTVRQWYALYEARVRRWHGVSRRDRWGMIGGRLVVPVEESSPPFWVWNIALRQLYLSAYHISPATAGAYVEAMRHHEIAYLLGYPSALYALAECVRASGLRIPSLRLVTTNAEPLYDHQRSAISQAFDVQVRDTYGMAEIVCMASECSAGRMHLWPDTGIVEVWKLDEPEPVEPGWVGRLICTGLLNADMPLIRYEVGDIGRKAPPTRACACNRAFPILDSVEGRLDDVIWTRDGRAVGRLDPVFKSDLPIREAQIVQESLEKIRVRLVPDDGFATHHAEAIEWRLKERIGDAHVQVELVKNIARTENGKVRGVISHVERPPRSNSTAGQ